MIRTRLIGGLSFFVLLVVVFCSFMYIAYEQTSTPQSVQQEELIELRLEDRPNVEIVEASVVSPTVIKDGGEVVYQYHYIFDSATKEVIEKTPTYLVGSTRNQIEQIFPDWQVFLFSEDKLILRKSVEAKSDEVYCLGTVDGYIGIFNENDRKEMKLQEKTEIPISTFSESDQNRLLEGINVMGEENLVKLLADFTT